ncbi:MAG: hydrogenase maturation protein HypF [Arcobacteraceae bacterium]
MFDAMVSLAGLLQIQSYEGEAGLLCENNYKYTNDMFDYDINAGIIEIMYDFFDIDLISKFINTIVQIIIDISKLENKDVILSGGVFQNKVLLELVIKKLENEKIKYYYQKNSPLNDSGISLGQVYKTCLNI